jgi:hypothetical protein
MVYLIWRKKVHEYIQDNFDNTENWDNWVIWRDFFLANKSPELAATEGHAISVAS